MSVLVWDAAGEKFFETGVSKGVFYDSDGLGVAWNGLVSVDEEVDSEVSPVHFDGVKIDDILTVGDFSGVVKAYTYPDEFLPYEGIVASPYEFYVTGQPYERFGLSYQTLVGDDITGPEASFKLHVLYNLTAIPGQKSYQTLSLDVEAHEFEWNITSVPEQVENYRPTSQLIFDSRKMSPEVLSNLQSVLYGNATDDAYLPPMNTLVKMMKEWVEAL